MSASASARLYWGGVAAKLGLLAVAVHVLNSMVGVRGGWGGEGGGRRRASGALAARWR